MTYQHSHRYDATGHEPLMNDDGIDASLIDAEFDDSLDRILADFRESLADLSSF
jgi:hypothetical protein